MPGALLIAMTLAFSVKQNSFSGMPEISSPCIGVCTLAPSGMCIGCLRTSEEIGMWSNYSAGDRLRIMLELPRRLESLFAL
jgi:predicted Fe-S protein YdhL (DUF1289 family)